MSNNDFALLIESTTRSTDDYVNATKWCQKFGKRWAKFKEMPQTQRYLKALQDKVSKVSPEIGLIQSKRGVGTFVHPLVAIKLAEWLSPEFEVYVKETFRRYMEGDVTLATEIVNRSSDLDAVKQHNKDSLLHERYLDTYHYLQEVGKEEYDWENKHHATVNKINNTAANVPAGKRAEMTRDQKMAMYALQATQGLVLKNKAENYDPLMDCDMDEPRRAWTGVNTCRDTAEKVKRIIEGK